MLRTIAWFEQELKLWTDAFPEKNAQQVKLELESAKKKPDMVDKGTQTELTWIEVTNMETSHNKVVDFIKKTNFIKDENKNKDVAFKLDMIERGIAGFKEDLDHSQTNGRELQNRLKLLDDALSQGKLNEQELADKINNLAELLKRKESEFQQKLKTKQEDWDKLRSDYDKLNVLYLEQNKTIQSKVNEVGELRKQLKEKENLEEAEKKKLQARIDILDVDINNEKRSIESLRSQISILENSVKDSEEKYRGEIKERERWQVEQQKAVNLKQEVERDIKNIFDNHLKENWDSINWKNNINKLFQKLQEQNVKVQERDRLLSQLDIYRRSKFVEINSSLFSGREKDYADVIRNSQGKRFLVFVCDLNDLKNFNSLQNRNEVVDLTKITSYSDYFSGVYFCWADWAGSAWKNRVTLTFYKNVEILKYNSTLSDVKPWEWPNELKFVNNSSPRFCIDEEHLIQSVCYYSVGKPYNSGKLELIENYIPPQSTTANYYHRRILKATLVCTQ